MPKPTKNRGEGERPAWVAYLITAAIALLVAGYFFAVTFVDHSTPYF